MSYEITIKERRDVRKTIGKKWDKVGTKEVEREERFYSVDPSQPKTRISDVMDYTPETITVVTEEREILKQTVDTLDLCAVIKAVNGLP